MIEKIFLVGLDEELIILSKKIGLNLSGVIDIDENAKHKELSIYQEKQLNFIENKIDSVIIGIDSPEKKKYLNSIYENANIRIASLLYTTLNSSCSTKDGLIIQENAIISNNCNFGKNVKVNIGATIMHDNIIGNFVTIAPRAVLLGRVIIEDCVFIGANATILPNVIVGRNSIVGAGAVVTKDVPHNTIARGVPARFYKKND